MYQSIYVAIMSVLAAVVIQAEVYAIIQAIAHASKLENSWVDKIYLGIARYFWASIILYETVVERPAYRLTIPGSLFVVLAIALQAQEVGICMSRWPALVVATGCALGYFAAAYGRAFVAHRQNVAVQQKEGTWNFVLFTDS